MKRFPSLQPSLRGMAIAMLAVMMLLVQPLSSSAWCLAAGMDCCSPLTEETAEETAPEPSCCGASESDDSEEGSTEEPCCCGLEKAPSSDLPPHDCGSVPAALVTGELDPFSGAAELNGSRNRRPAYRARAPGCERPARVLFQVFRL